MITLVPHLLADTATGMTLLLESIRSGGFIMILIVLSSMLAVTVSVISWLRMREDLLMPPEIEKQLRSLPQFALKGDITPLQRLLAEDQSMLGRLGAMAVSGTHPTRQECTEVVTQAAKVELYRLEKDIPFLEVMVTIAPLLGLLGTTAGLVGMFSAFGEGGAGGPDTSAIAREIGCGAALHDRGSSRGGAFGGGAHLVRSEARWHLDASGGHPSGVHQYVLPALRSAAPQQETRLMNLRRQRRAVPAIPIVSLIDIMVILLIFTTATTTFKKNKTQMEIALPESKSMGSTTSKPDARLTLAITKEHKIFLDSNPVELDKLAEALKKLRAENPDVKLELEADTSTALGVLIKVWDGLKAAGIPINDVPARIQRKE